MADVIAVEGYLDQLQALLPRGAAWTRERTATLTALLGAIAEALARTDGAACALLDEVIPATTLDLLPDWERVAGLPDACSPDEASTRSVRRGRVLTRLVSRPLMIARVYEQIALSLGYDSAVVVEHDEAAAARILGLDTTGGRWRYVWWLRLVGEEGRTKFNALSDVSEALCVHPTDEELECRVRAAMPAHTHVVFDYRMR